MALVGFQGQLELVGSLFCLAQGEPAQTQEEMRFRPLRLTGCLLAPRA